MTVKLMHFVSSDSMWELSHDAFEKEKKSLLELLPDADIQHVGSTSIPGAITKGDLDIQVRISKEGFAEAIEKLRRRYTDSHPEIWRDGFASFQNYANPDIPIGVQLTIRDTAYDDFYIMRDEFINNPQLLQQYNSFKKDFEGKPEPDYKMAKKGLFGDNGNTKLLN